MVLKFYVRWSIIMICYSRRLLRCLIVLKLVLISFFVNMGLNLCDPLKNRVYSPKLSILLSEVIMSIDKTEVNEKLAQLSADIAGLLGTPGIADYIGGVLDWNLQVVDGLIMVALESLLEDDNE